MTGRYSSHCSLTQRPFTTLDPYPLGLFKKPAGLALLVTQLTFGAVSAQMKVQHYIHMLTSSCSAEGLLL